MTTYCDTAGRTVTADEALDASGRLRSGFGIRTPIHLMDGVQKSVAAGHTHDAAQGFTDARGVDFGPDQRVADAQRATDRQQGRDEVLRQQWRDGRAASEQARDEMIRDTASAWKDAAPPAGAYPYSAAAEGGECTIDGASGVLVKQGNWLVCKPRRASDRPGASDARDGADPRAAAYAEMVRDTDYRTRNHG